jgi:hypothetical protein
VLGRRSGSGLPLPQAKAPSRVARCVIRFGPECHWRGSGSFVCAVGVGRENWRSDCCGCIPRKIGPQFHRSKHTSLIRGNLAQHRTYQRLTEVNCSGRWRCIVTMRDPGLAAVLSAIIPGVGQFYNGRILAGILWLIITPGLWIGTGGLLGWVSTSSLPTPLTATPAITGCVSLRARVFPERRGREYSEVRKLG